MTILSDLRKSIRSGFIIICASLLVYPFCQVESQQTKPPSAADFKKQLVEASVRNNDEAVLSLMRNNRFMVKPFVDGLVRECISDELNGNTEDCEEKKAILQKTAGSFESLFGEKSLSIAVNYLAVWSKEQKRRKLVADSIYAIGTRLRLAKDNDKAITELNKALAIYSEIRDERGEAEALGGLGAIYFESDYEKCNFFYTQALSKREKVDDRQLIGNTLNSFGSVCTKFLKDYPQAIKWYDRAETLRTEIGDVAGLRTTYTFKASAHRVYADKLNLSAKYPEAINQAEMALVYYTNINNKSELAETLSLMGFIYSNLGNDQTAIEKLNEALKIKQELNDSSGIAGVLNHYGIVLQHAGRTERALEYFNKSMSIYEAKGQISNIIPILNNLGTLFFDMKEYSRAEDYYKKGLQISRELQEKENEAHILLNLANDLIFLGRFEESMACYDSALEITRTSAMPDLTWRVLAGMAEIYERKGEYEKALKINDSMLNLVDSIRSTLDKEEFKSSYLAKERFVFEDIVNLLADLDINFPGKGYDEQAFGYAEQSKSRTLLDLLAGSSKNITGGKNPVPVALKDVQEMLPDKNTVILEYMTGDSSSCLWVITKSEHRIFKVPANKRLKEEIEAVRFAMLDPKQGASDFFTTPATSLYEELLKPAEPYLTKSSRLIIVPDGILNYLPFEVLLTNKPADPANVTYAGMPYLVRKYPVSYVQSASILKGLLSMQTGSGKTKPADRRLIAFSDPVYEGPSGVTIGGERLRRLEYSGQEAEKIGSLFKAGNAEIYAREKATEENIKLEGYLSRFSYLHFATHGYIDENKPDLSSLVLTKNENSDEDGLLQATEIFNLKLMTDLVVLSACQTGLGKLVRGEGIVGLTRAFMYAGTPSVLVSLWSVSDNSTATLMGEFYTSLIKSRLNKTDALRKAQITLMNSEKFAHPFYWAPFILIGDWR